MRVIGTIGVPGSGKTTYANGFDRREWVTLELDNLRAAFWPPTKRVYWDLLQGPVAASASRVLHAAHEAALRAALTEGFNVLLPNTHAQPAKFRGDLEVIAEFGVTVEWKLFDVPLPELLARNARRPEADRLNPDAVAFYHTKIWAEDAWWRSLPAAELEIIRHEEREAA